MPTKLPRRGVICLARRYHGNTDSRYYYDWLDHAGEDLIAAQMLLVDDRCSNLCAFHCQQAIEKALKSYILLKSGLLVDGHNLTWLCKKAVQYDPKFSRWMEQCADLNRCYIETRYPSDLDRDVPYHQAAAACRMAQEMFLFLCAQIDDYFLQNPAPAKVQGREATRR